jgi:hypothetical protein
MESSQEIFINKLTNEKNKRESENSIHDSKIILLSSFFSFVVLFLRFNLIYLGYYVFEIKGWAPILGYLNFLCLACATHFTIQYIKSIFKK